MSNYENLKPYNDFAQTAAKNGGVVKYLEMLETINFNRGVMSEKKKVWGKVAVASGITFFATQLGNVLYNKAKDWYQKHSADLEKESNAAKEAVIKTAKESKKELEPELEENRIEEVKVQKNE